MSGSDSPGLKEMEVAEGWQAELRLCYAQKGGRTILAENSHYGPLRVQRPLYPEEGVCHTCILHPPGGLVGGDSLRLELAVGPSAHALVTTPGATKFYRSCGRPAIQRQQLSVQGGVLEWFPQETIIFPGADAEIATEIRLDKTAHFIGWEIICLGLPTKNEPFVSGRLRSRLAVYRDGRPLFIDRLQVAGRDDVHSVIGLRGYPVTGCFVAGGVSKELVAELRGCLPNSTGCLVGITLMGELLVARYLGESTSAARDIFQNLWTLLRPRLIDRNACPPRIWST
jgi:urease accessory protein